MKSYTFLISRAHVRLQSLRKSSSSSGESFGGRPAEVKAALADGSTISGPTAVVAESGICSNGRERLIQELQTSLAEVKTLRGIVPICSSCKKIRDDRGYWQQVDTYVGEHSHAEFSHGLCPECMAKLYPDYADSLGTDNTP